MMGNGQMIQVWGKMTANWEDVQSWTVHGGWADDGGWLDDESLERVDIGRWWGYG